MERTNYMQAIMTETYSDVAIEAIKTGFNGAWERVIARRLERDYINGHSEAEVIVESAGSLKQASYLITSSKIPEHETK